MDVSGEQQPCAAAKAVLHVPPHKTLYSLEHNNLQRNVIFSIDAISVGHEARVLPGLVVAFCMAALIPLVSAFGSTGNTVQLSGCLSRIC